MADFPLFDGLPPILQEQIIAKLDWKSYFRFQRTCRQMGELIRTSRKLYTYVDKKANFKFVTRPSGKIRVQLQFATGTADVPDVYGVRLRVLSGPRYLEGDKFPRFCQVVKKHRITCYRLRLDPSLTPGGIELTKERCAELIKALNPDEIHMSTDVSNRFEALVHSRNLEQLYLSGMDPLKIVSIMGDLTRHREVNLEARCTALSMEEIDTVIRSVCQILQSGSQSPWNLHTFNLHLTWHREVISREKLIEKLGITSLFGEIQDGIPETSHFMTKPGRYKRNIIIIHGGGTVSYQRIE